ncbi:MAG: methyl-accepting chemotaxis protein [Bacillota bacterium]|nr:methyl-accepting chemotaxis protein [Bacillota bacterium]
MSKRWRNIKITHLLIFMFIIVIASTSIIVGIGLKELSNIDQNVETIHNDDLVPIKMLGDIRQNFMMARISTVKCIWGSYDSSEADKIDKYKAKAEEIEQQYAKAISEEKEKKAYEEYKQAYKEYFDGWNEIKQKRIQNVNLTDDERKEYTVKGENVVKTLNALADLNSNQADAEKSLSEKSYEKCIGVFFTAGCLVILVSAAIVLLILLIVKNCSKEIIENLGKIAEGDLTVIIDDSNKNEFGIMNRALRKSITNIHHILQSIKLNSNAINEQSSSLSAVAEEMSASSHEVANAIQEIARGSSSQAEDLVETTHSVEHFGESIEKIVNSIGHVDNNAKNIDSMAKESNKSLEVLIKSIENIDNSFKNISDKINGLGNNINEIQEIIILMNSISEQTNLLALNAAIEAARAGEAGKGFSVVADEIRKLAEESKRSADNINSLLNRVIEETSEVVLKTDEASSDLGNQVSIVQDSVGSFKDIITEIGNILPKIEEVNEGAIYINREKDNIMDMIGRASSVAEQTSASSEEIAASSQEMNASSEEVSRTAEDLNNMTNEMINQVSKFNL